MNGWFASAWPVRGGARRGAARRRSPGRQDSPLHVESLEARMLLSVTAGGDSTATPLARDERHPAVAWWTEQRAAAPVAAESTPWAAAAARAAATADEGVDAPLPASTIRITGAKTATFNPLTTPVGFTITGDRFSRAAGDVQVTLNGSVVPAARITVTATRITLQGVLREGRNVVEAKAYGASGAPLFFGTTVWAGSRTLRVAIVDDAGKPVRSPVSVKALLGDDQSVFSAATSKAGVVVLTNVPDRTILLQAVAGSRLGFLGVTGAAGTATVRLQSFNPGKPAAATALQAAAAAGMIAAPVAPAAAAAGEPSTIVYARSIATGGEGETTDEHAFRTQSGVTAVRVRYRFTTSEVPGGYFGSRYNDYYRVVVQTAKGSVVETKTMNELGLAAFDGGGRTRWREQTLHVDPKGPPVVFRGAVANVGDGEYDSGLEFEVQELRPGLSYALAWDPADGGLRVVWKAAGDLPADTTVGVHFANGTGYDDILGSSAFTFTVPAGTRAGTSRSVQIPGSALAAAPEGGVVTHLVVASDRSDAEAIKDVVVAFGTHADKSVVGTHSLDVVRNALRAAGKSSVTITSTIRTAEDQARVMFAALTSTASIAANVKKQLDLYRAPGRQVVEVFKDAVKGLTLAQINARAATIRQAMTARIVELQGAEQLVSRHCVSPERYAVLNVLDVPTAAFSTASRGRFVAVVAAQAGPPLVEGPPNNAIHMQIPQ